MKSFIYLLLLVGCATVQSPKVSTPVQAPVETTKPVEIKAPAAPTVAIETPVEVPTNLTRYVVESPLDYQKYIPRVEKFFKLALTDASVLNRATFDFSDATPKSIREKINGGIKVTITTYRPSLWKGGRWSKAIAYHYDNTIYLNSYYVTRPDCEVINTIAHESMHALGYSHGNNSSKGKDNSVPYWIGDRAQELCEAGKI